MFYLERTAYPYFCRRHVDRQNSFNFAVKFVQSATFCRRRVCLLFLSPNGREVGARFQPARLLAQVSHPNILSQYNAIWRATRAKCLRRSPWMLLAPLQIVSPSRHERIEWDDADKPWAEGTNVSLPSSTNVLWAISAEHYASTWILPPRYIRLWYCVYVSSVIMWFALCSQSKAESSMAVKYVLFR